MALEGGPRRGGRVREGEAGSRKGREETGRGGILEEEEGGNWKGREGTGRGGRMRGNQKGRQGRGRERGKWKG